MNVAFLDLHAQYLSIKKDLDLAIAETIKHSAYIKSPAVSTFEEEFGAYIGIDHVVACGNGTDAIEILLSAMQIGQGDEVLVPAMSWISTSETVATAGATPIFVDIHADTCLIDETKIEHNITKRTKAIIPVHLYGRPANMPAIIQLAKKYNLKVIEDCAQAHGAKINDKTVGTFGDAATFSFFPTKNLGAYGDAGALVTSNADLAEIARIIANHGQKERHTHSTHGRNSRMDGMQAAILSVKLKHLASWTETRIQKAALYTSLLRDINGIELPSYPKSMRHVFHLYVIRTKQREALREYLTEHGIDSLVHYPKALPFQPCYKDQHMLQADYPVVHQVQDEILSLPLYPELDDAAIRYVAQTIANFTAQ